MTAGGIVVVPASADRWPDVATLLGGDAERGCWCQAWRGSAGAFGHAAAGANRAALQAQIGDGAFPPGVLAYAGAEPVGWCGLGPKAAMPRLLRSRTIPRVDDVGVWAIGCFVVRVGYRRRGLTRTLLDGAVATARAAGARAIEAYPIDPAGRRVSGAFGFVGFASTFERAGFRRILETGARSAGLPRWLVRLDLDRQA